MSEKKLMNYVRQKQGLNLETWIKHCTILSEENQLFDLIKSIINEEVEEIKYNDETKTYVINGKYHFVPDEMTMLNCLVMLYPEHYEVYRYNWHPESILELSIEEYSYNRKGICNVAFSHLPQDNHMTSIIWGCNIGISIETIGKQMQFYKVVKDYTKIFDELVHKDEDFEKSTFDKMFEVYKILLDQINENVKGFGVRCKTETLVYSEGNLESIRLATNGGFVTVTDQDIMFQDILINNKFYTYHRGKAIDINLHEVEDIRLNKRIMSAFTYGKRRFQEIEEESKY